MALQIPVWEPPFHFQGRAGKKRGKKCVIEPTSHQCSISITPKNGGIEMVFWFEVGWRCVKEPDLKKNVAAFVIKKP